MQPQNDHSLAGARKVLKQWCPTVAEFSETQKTSLRRLSIL